MQPIGSPLGRWKRRLKYRWKFRVLRWKHGPTRRKTVTFGGIRILYEPRHDGGGRFFGQDFVRVVSDLGPVDRLAEWCAGPAFIGFSLYGHGLCKRLDLLEINPASAAVAKKTMHRNKVPGRVWLSDCFDSTPGEKWDLIVASPPHVPTDEVPPDTWSPEIIYRDLDWKIHRKFYSQLADHLTPGGRLVIQENPQYAKPDDFTEMIEAGGLKVEAVLDCPTEMPMFYLVVQAAART